MTKVVNLNRFRKRKDREDAAARAAENRAKFGRTREQKALDTARAEEAQRKLDAIRREPLPDP